MNKQTTLWLLLLLAGLGTAVWWQIGREEAELGAIDVPIFEGVRLERVKGLRVDHIERGTQLRLTRDARGAWYLVDPIVYPADLAAVGVLLDVIGNSRALIVPRVERDARELGFDPPRAIFTVEEEVDGQRLEHVIELGYLDLDGQRVNARERGRYLRILRKLDTSLKRTVEDFRSKRVVDIDPNAVVEVNRTGTYQETVESEPIDLRLSAIRDGASWRSLLPHEAALEPLDVAVLLHGTAGLEVDAFLDDAPLTLAEHGLEEPELSIELRSASGARELVHLSRGGFGRTWKAAREGHPYVFRVAPESVTRLLVPFEEFLDLRLVRALRREIGGLRLECDGRVVRVERAGEGWQVGEERAGDGGSVSWSPASNARVEGILTRLEWAEAAGFQLDRPFPAGGPALGVYLDLGGALQGGRFGPAVTGPDGGAFRLFQRVQDGVSLFVDPALAELACTGLHELRSLELSDVPEYDLTGLELRRGDARLGFVRSDRGRWSPAGEEREATELLGLLDPLIFLRAREHLPAALGALDDPIEVSFARRDGGTLRYTVGLLAGDDGAPVAAVDLERARSYLRAADLHARLRALLDP